MASIREAINSLEKDFSPLKVTRKAMDYSLVWYTKRPGFFNSFKSLSDAACAVVYPFVGPIVLGALALVTSILTAIAAIVFVGGYLFAKVASCFSEKVARDAMENAVFGGYCGLATAAATLTLAISAIVALPVTGIQVITRTGATLAEKAADCCRSEEEEPEEWLELK